MFQEFQLSVTPLGQDHYLVRTEQVASGVPLAEEQVYWSVEDWLQQAGQLMDDPMFRLFQDQDSLATEFLFITGQLPAGATEEVSPSLVELGQQLYDALLQGSLRDSWMMAQAIAHNQRSVLRFRLGLKGSRLLRLPWEVLHGGSRDTGGVFRPLSTGPDIAFSRYQIGTALGSDRFSFPQKPRQPLRVLMAIASPEDQDSLALHQEALQLQAELQPPDPDLPPNIELTLLEQPGRAELTQALEQGNYQVFHYAGHSNLGESGGDVYLVSRTTGLTEKLYGQDLAGLLVNNGIQLAVFNSCRGTDTALNPKDDNQTNLAQALVNRGIPAVLAMAERIPDEVALTFTRLFYRNLDQGYPIDLSLSRARQGLISAYGSNQLYWALPVLYLHPEFNGVLIPSPALPDPFDLEDPDDLPLGFLTGDEEEMDGDSYLEDDPYLEDLDPLETEEEDEEFLADLVATARITSREEEDDFLRPAKAESDEEDLSFIQDVLSETPSVVTPPSPVTPPPRETPDSPPQRSFSLAGLWGGMLAMVLMFGGVVWIWGRIYYPSFFSNPLDALLTRDDPVDLDRLDLTAVSTEQLTSFAIEQFNRGEIGKGAIAVETLLDRNVLSHGASVLAGVKPEQRDAPEILFLLGRLAWQSVQIGDSRYSVSDARRYWSTAIEKAPQRVEYYNALGFAYYAEGNYDQANQTWYDALELLDPQMVGSVDETGDRTTLNTYAGLALGLQKLAENQTGDARTTLLNKAYKLRQTVMNQDPLGFQVTRLAQDWLWTESAIADWQSLASLD
ncbi:CHAT domain-containing protein [Spirulina subsalsa FACHB-351]|uniref:CHAT domain-containing protein n=1 Tax=Spirulina subsalsa FACHB-351 TaxID=234711 RepID=A0ABT3L104_9CYAN|nr:CHAT domain-containing protein [Spirulina subsalsa]MCW6035147.1 CHAT domain-containing protein [Spirulina subsalsa FACHB-351]